MLEKNTNAVQNYDLVSIGSDLFVGVVWVDVLDGGGHQFVWKLRCQPDWKWHPSFQEGVSSRPVVIVVVIVSNLDKNNHM